MSSGVSAFGGTGPCYRFWVSFRECRRVAGEPAACALEQADYLECLHRKALKSRIADKALEVQRQKAGPAAAAHAGGGH